MVVIGEWVFLMSEVPLRESSEAKDKEAERVLFMLFSNIQNEKAPLFVAILKC